MTVGSWIGLGILIVGILSLVYKNYTNKKKDGARVLFHLDRQPNSGFYEFTIENTGNQDAENFSFLINGEDPTEYDYILFDLNALTVIRSGAIHSKRIGGPQGLSIIRVSASYQDESGNHEIEQTLNF